MCMVCRRADVVITFCHKYSNLFVVILDVERIVLVLHRKNSCFWSERSLRPGCHCPCWYSKNFPRLVLSLYFPQHFCLHALLASWFAFFLQLIFRERLQVQKFIATAAHYAERIHGWLSLSSPKIQISKS